MNNNENNNNGDKNSNNNNKNNDINEEKNDYTNQNIYNNFDNDDSDNKNKNTKNNKNNSVIDKKKDTRYISQNDMNNNPDNNDNDKNNNDNPTKSIIPPSSTQQDKRFPDKMPLVNGTYFILSILSILSSFLFHRSPFLFSPHLFVEIDRYLFFLFLSYRNQSPRSSPKKPSEWIRSENNAIIYYGWGCPHSPDVSQTPTIKEAAADSHSRERTRDDLTTCISCIPLLSCSY